MMQNLFWTSSIQICSLYDCQLQPTTTCLCIWANWRNRYYYNNNNYLARSVEGASKIIWSCQTNRALASHNHQTRWKQRQTRMREVTLLELFDVENAPQIRILRKLNILGSDSSTAGCQPTSKFLPKEKCVVLTIHFFLKNWTIRALYSLQYAS